MGEKILVVDDVPEMRNLLQLELQREGYDVRVSENGVEAGKAVKESLPDLILLDVVMPEMNGWDFLKGFREKCEIPVIMLTALGQTEEIVQALDWGADDYLCKPFDMKELLARIRNSLRHGAKGSVLEATMLCNGEICIDCIRREVTINHEKLVLSPKEYELLEYFMRNCAEPILRKRILKDVWGTESFVDEKTVDVYVHFLRKKLRRAGMADDTIKAVRGVGYQMQKYD